MTKLRKRTSFAFYSFSLFFLISCLSSCTSYQIRQTNTNSAEKRETNTPEVFLLDVGVQIFAPDVLATPTDERLYKNVRESESIWVAQQLKNTLESSRAWGVVRIIPDTKVIMDLRVNGKILQSDGETLALHVTTYDTSGEVWLDKEYRQTVSRYSYDPANADFEPFQSLYNDISNDLLDILKSTPLDTRADLRTISSVRFAQSFSPEAFGEYLIQDEPGIYRINSLPAANDPAFKRIREIQLRDQLFVDVLQTYYLGFSDNMDASYREWREQSYRETQIIRELEGTARARRLGGWLTILGGATALLVDSNGSEFNTVDVIQNVSGSVAIFAGVETLRSSFQKKDEAALHIETLSELGQSLESELEPSVIELQDRTVTLTGTVRNQYEDWRKILADIYYAETGYARPEEEQTSETYQ